MAHYNGINEEEDEFSPKKYATVSALKDMFKQQYASGSGDAHSHGHGHVHDGSEEDMLYHQKMYGKKEDENPLGSDYLRRKDEEDELAKKTRDETKKEDENFPGDKYKKINDEEIAQTLFRTSQQGVFSLQEEERQIGKNQFFAEDDNTETVEEVSGEKTKKKWMKSKSVEDILRDLPWEKGKQ